MESKKPKTKAGAKAEARATATHNQNASKPDWLTAPVPEAMYQLSFRTEECDVEPLIDLSRSEFIELKHHLAVLRGHIAPEVTNAN